MGDFWCLFICGAGSGSGFGSHRGLGEDGRGMEEGRGMSGFDFVHLHLTYSVRVTTKVVLISRYRIYTA
jgi:hypothetical protein